MLVTISKAIWIVPETQIPRKDVKKMRIKEETKRVEVYLPAEVADVVAREAKAEHLSLSGYCSVIIDDAVKELYNSDSPPSDDEEDEDYNETVHIQLRGKDAAVLKRKAAELSFSPTRWGREAVLQKNLTIYWGLSAGSGRIPGYIRTSC